MRSKHRALLFLLPLLGLELSCERDPPRHPLPNSICKTTCHKRQSMQLLLATAHLLKAGLIAHLSVQSPQAHTRVHIYPAYPSFCRKLLESHGSNQERKQDSKVCLLASATNPKEIQFYDDHTYRYCATDSMQKYIWEAKEHILGTGKQPHEPRT